MKQMMDKAFSLADTIFLTGQIEVFLILWSLFLIELFALFSEKRFLLHQWLC
jgi:hypothetical protein